MMELKADSYPEEVTVSEAVDILGVSRSTVMKYMEAKLIRVRNIAPPTSAKKAWRLLKEDVVALRTGYGVIKKATRAHPQPVVARIERPTKWIKMYDN